MSRSCASLLPKFQPLRPETAMSVTHTYSASLISYEYIHKKLAASLCHPRSSPTLPSQRKYSAHTICFCAYSIKIKQEQTAQLLHTFRSPIARYCIRAPSAPCPAWHCKLPRMHCATCERAADCVLSKVGQLTSELGRNATDRCGKMKPASTYAMTLFLNIQISILIFLLPAPGL